MAACTPTASGTLAKTPFAHLLVYCLDRELTGTLTLRDGHNDSDTIFFERGAPVKVKTTELVAPLGELLVEMGSLDPAMRDELLARQSGTGRLLGELLLDQGFVDRRALRATLRVQMRRKLAALATRVEATQFAFYDEQNLLEGWGSSDVVPIEPLALIMASIRERPPISRVAEMATRLANTPMLLHSEADSERLEATATEYRALDVLRARHVTLNELESCGIAPAITIRAFVYALLITRYIGTSDMTKLPVGVHLPTAPSSSRVSIAAPVARVQLLRGTDMAMPSVIEINASRPDSSHGPPSTLSPALRALRDDLARLARDLPLQDHFEALGVARTASQEEVKGAFFELAKRYHPDRVPARISTSREAAAKVFARLSEAFHTLSDARRREEYEKTLGSATSAAVDTEQNQVARATEAALEFQKAEILLKNGDMEGAARFAQRAIALDPGQADYRALIAWMRTLRPQGLMAPQEELVAAIKQLDELLIESPEHQRALWYRGSLLKRIGEIDRAARDFRALCRLDEHHIDAARELRLFEMRRGRSPSSSRKLSLPPPSLLGRLFNKK